ncbi:MAG TPA: hypothetical protein ENG40_03660, partial [Thermoprotei archaeon]|nr:hypothetical protein [Thermoprotei archaeon]
MSEEKLRIAKNRWIITYIVLLAVLIIITIHFIILSLVEENPYTSTMIFMLILGSGYISYNLWKMIKIEIPVFKTFMLVKCSSCGHAEIMSPKKGDYVFKIIGPCPKCGGEFTIYSI